jgi:hypothetical protein
MITLVYIGFIIFIVAVIIAIGTIGTLMEGMRRKCDAHEITISDLQDDIFYMKIEIAKLKSTDAIISSYSRAA